jgi:hypothetical protein
MKVEEHGLMDHGGDRSRFPYSREWEDIDCSAVSCQFNGLNKCISPSLAKINAEGKCAGFKSNVEHKKASTNPIMDLNVKEDNLMG